MYRLQSPIMHYAWGSHERIASLMSRPTPTPEPEAELWVGSHPRSPSFLLGSGSRTSLEQAVRADPTRMLGRSCAERFGNRLPFMLKVIAPRQPLSIQCHPSAAQLRSADAGTYVDDRPKPEALLAVSRFQIFAGLKTFAQVRDTIDEFGIVGLRPFLQRVSGHGDPVHALLEMLLSVPSDQRRELVRGCVHACRADPSTPRESAAGAIASHASTFPEDIGLVVLLLMNHHVLEPGSYISIPAGVLHSYVEGIAVEILANSDNVVRAGLTRKKIDRRELLRIVETDQPVTPEPPARPEPVHTYPSSTPYLRLHSIQPTATAQALPAAGLPRLGLVTHGNIVLKSPVGRLKLSTGDSCFIPADTDPVTARGNGVLALGSPGAVEQTQ